MPTRKETLKASAGAPKASGGAKKQRVTPRLSQTERVAVSDAKMFEVATRLISERGTHNTTLKDVGEQAGYSRGLASNRFGSKEELFSRLMTYFNAKWKQQIEKFVGDLRGLEAFLASFDAVEDCLLNQPEQMRAMYILWYESFISHPEMRKRHAKTHEIYRRDAANWLDDAKRDGQIRSNIDTRTFAALYWSFLAGTIYQWLVNPAAIDLEQVFCQQKRFIVSVLVEPRQAKGSRVA